MKYLVLLLCLVGCSSGHKPGTFTCITAFGPVQFKPENILELTKDYIKIEQEGKKFLIGRQVCVEELAE